MIVVVNLHRNNACLDASQIVWCWCPFQYKLLSCQNSSDIAFIEPVHNYKWKFTYLPIQKNPGIMLFQITSFVTVCSTACTDQSPSKPQTSALLALCQGEILHYINCWFASITASNKKSNFMTSHHAMHHDIDNYH